MRPKNGCGGSLCVEAQKERRQMLGRESLLLTSPKSASPKAIRSRAMVAGRRFQVQGRHAPVCDISVDNSPVKPHGPAAAGVSWIQAVWDPTNKARNARPS